MAKARKDIDKDLMFQKIMPSADIVNKKNSADKSLVEEEISPQQNDTQFMQSHGITLPQKNETYLINIVEKAVSDNLDGVLERFKCCKCDRCKKDIIALSLNALTPKYIVATAGKSLSDHTVSQTASEVTTAIVRSVIKVKAEPRH